MTIWAIVPAAGTGSRMQADIPKQYLQIDNIAIVDISIAKLQSLQSLKKIVVMLHRDDLYWSDCRSQGCEDVVARPGGENRYQSVLKGLEYLQPHAAAQDWVLVHDAVRPCVRVADIHTLCREIAEHPVGGLLAAPVGDTLKLSDPHLLVQSTVDRSALWSAFTPQIFRYAILFEALNRAQQEKCAVTDESGAVEKLGHKPRLVLGHTDNIKITRPEDLAMAQVILANQAELANVKFQSRTNG